MKEISINELQADAGWWVRQAALEQQIVITEQGHPVAALIPFPAAQLGQPLPDREERIRQRAAITIDSADYIAALRDCACSTSTPLTLPSAI